MFTIRACTKDSENLKKNKTINQRTSVRSRGEDKRPDQNTQAIVQACRDKQVNWL